MEVSAEIHTKCESKKCFVNLKGTVVECCSIGQKIIVATIGVKAAVVKLYLTIIAVYDS